MAGRLLLAAANVVNQMPFVRKPYNAQYCCVTQTRMHSLWPKCWNRLWKKTQDRASDHEELQESVSQVSKAPNDAFQQNFSLISNTITDDDDADTRMPHWNTSDFMQTQTKHGSVVCNSNQIDCAHLSHTGRQQRTTIATNGRGEWVPEISFRYFLGRARREARGVFHKTGKISLNTKKHTFDKRDPFSNFRNRAWRTEKLSTTITCI